MMELSGISDVDKEKHELYILKLEHELDRVRLSLQLNESIWSEKEESLSSIISEQKQVISLLESLLKSNQQYYDQLQNSVAQKDAALQSLNDDIESTLAQTRKQFDNLSRNWEKTEAASSQKDAQLLEQSLTIAEQIKQIESLQSLLKGAESEAKESLLKLQESQKSLIESRLQIEAYEHSGPLLQEQLDISQKSLADTKQEAEKRLQESKELEAQLKQSLRQRDEYKAAYENLQTTFSQTKEKIEAQLRDALKRKEDTELVGQRLQTELKQQKSILADMRDAVSKQEAAGRILKTNSEREINRLQTEYEREKQKTAELEKKLSVNLQNIAILQSGSKELESKCQRLEVSLNGLSAREQRYRKNIESLESRLVHAREAGYKTISYQLGYAVIQSTKSFSNFLRLPSALIQIRKEARRRTEQKRTSRTVVLNAKPIEPTIESSPGSALISTAKLRPAEPTSPVKLRVAAIMDEFTYHSYAPEADVLQLHPETWRTQISEFKPDLLFIESAWNGLEGLWKTKISNADPALLELIEWCRQSKVPSLFWNKEDPVHFSTFIPVASRVDAIFTTDVDCLPKYKQAVGHSRVYLLPFAAQPLTHNPIEKYERKDAFNFAGSYYLRYPERQRDFASLIDTVVKLRPLEIYDRNFDNPHPHYIFPEKFQQYILGTLPFNEIDKAYKGYRYGINMNTIKQSQTMFARRVFELLASNTVVVSNFSRGVRLLFGDLVVSSDNTRELQHRLQAICNDETGYRKLRLAGLRRVMSEHTYHARLQYISKKLLGHTSGDENPVVYIVAKVKTQKEYDQLIHNTKRQSYKYIRVVVVSNTELGVSSSEHTVVQDSKALAQYMNAMPREGYIAFFSSNDYYGRNYICDLVLARHFSTATVVGKSSYYYLDDSGSVVLAGDGGQYRPATALHARCALIRQADLSGESLVQVASEVDNYIFRMSNMLALDEFNYCREAGLDERDRVALIVDDLHLANQGLSLANDLSEIAVEVKDLNSEKTDISLPQISAADIAQRIPKSNNPLIDWGMKGDLFQIASRLPADKYTYLYSRKIYSRQEVNMVLNSQFKLECEATCQLKTVFEFQDKDGKKIAHAMNAAGDFNALAIPEHCKKIRFGLRVQGPGDVRISRLILGTHGQKPAAIVSASPYLVLTKQYPDYDDLYKYGFLHTRVRAYKEHGLNVSVFKITNEKGNAYREFEDVDVVSGDAHLLDATLSTGQYKNVLVHLLDEKMWSVLEKHLDKVHVTVWVHGAEIQVWQRRQFEFERMSKDEISRQKKLSDKRLKFWRSILSAPHSNLKLVFVSQYFAEEVSNDFGIDLKKIRYDIVHNYIDGNVFPYKEKDPAQRKRLLSIRPYASRKYANDLTVNAILELSKRDFFDELEISLYGDGDLFEEITAPLIGFDNVKLHRRFLSHHEISTLHKDYGVFLSPTRMDSQGVSRDEAMSSGLVPITTNVTAIPEFVDSECGMLVEGEDYIGMANAIEELYRSPELFRRLSRNASERVARQSGLEQTILKEMAIIEENS